MSVEKFRIKVLYDKLNRDQQRILKAYYTKKFGVSTQQFYNVLNGADWNADQLIFFSDMFDCEPRDLYIDPPPLQKRLEDLEKEKDELLNNRKNKLLSRVGLA